MTAVIIIPARYGSTRFPGKPLAKLSGKEILRHVFDHACSASQALPESVDIYVTTDDTRISSFCEQHDIPVLLTDESCPTGTDRVHQALMGLDKSYDFVVNLQGDAPFCYPDFIQKIIQRHTEYPDSDIITPLTQLSWGALEELRASKEQTPFSGTTVVMDAQHNCLWFSKNIIPAIRNEHKIRNQSPLSPVFRHIGLYGFKASSLRHFVSMPVSQYERLEGLEQLRALEAGMKIKGVEVSYNNRPAMSGIDSPEDLARAENLLMEGV